MSLNRLIAEASVLAGGRHQCADLGHAWTAVGGRQCPRSTDLYTPNCSQTVYECLSCGWQDYGEKGGPAHDECYVTGPCSFACSEADAADDRGTDLYKISTLDKSV